MNAETITTPITFAPVTVSRCRCCAAETVGEVAICDRCLDFLADDDVADHAAPVVVVGTDEVTRREVFYGVKGDVGDVGDEDAHTPLSEAATKPSQITPDDVARIEAEAAAEQRRGDVCGTCATKTGGVCSRKGCNRRCCATCMDEDGLCPMCEEV